MSTLHTKYRPKEFDEVVSNTATINSINVQLNTDSQRAFLIHGETGTGKTTLARLIADKVGAESWNITEMNAGADTGVDFVRALLEQSRYRGLGDRDTKVFILDEVHMLTKHAWNALLKCLEEPPEWLYWVLCTTEIAKVPKTVISRCSVHATERVDEDLIVAHLRRICESESIDVEQELLVSIAENSEGSLRRAITLLGTCRDVTTTKLAEGFIPVAPEDEQVIGFCRALSKAKGFSDLQPSLKTFAKTKSPEGVRRVVLNYFSTVALNAKSAPQFKRAATILKKFGTSYGSDTGAAPLICSSCEFIEEIK